MKRLSRQDLLEVLGSCKNYNKIERDKKYIYLIGSSSGLTKIGRSSKPENRLRAIRANLNTPQELTLLFSKFVLTSSSIERNIHKKYKESRVKSEWFNLTQDDIENIIGHLENGLEF